MIQLKNLNDYRDLYLTERVTLLQRNESICLNMITYNEK